VADTSTHAIPAPAEPLTPWIVAACVIAAAIYLLRLDRVAGLVVDDAWYILLARSIAQGTGYGLINSPETAMVLPPNPPGFALVLSAVFWLQPSFPDNVILLKLVSVASMFAVGFASYRYAAWRDMPRPLALALAFAIVITPAFVFLATSTVMSECLFTLVQLTAILVLERTAATASNARAFQAGLLSGAALLIRTAGLPGPAGGVLYLLWRRRWGQAAVFTAAVLLCVGPWQIYSRAHAPTQAQREAHGGAHAFTYGQEFWMRWAGSPGLGTVTWRDLPGRIKDGLIDVFGRDIGGILMPTLSRTPAESGEEVISVGGGQIPASMGSAAGTMVASGVLSLIAAIGFVSMVRGRGVTAAEIIVPLSIGLIVSWPQWAYRFVLPLAPFIFVYVINGLRALSPSWAIPRVALLCLIGLNLADHTLYIVQSRSARVDWAEDAREIDEVFAWLEAHATEPGHVATTNPALVYLRAVRRTVAIHGLSAKWKRWTQGGVRYIVGLRPTELPSAHLNYTLLYRTSRHGLWIVAN
jgi:hypothetical protein